MEKSQTDTRNSTHKPDITKAYYSTDSHPSPIIFNGLNLKAEMLWNEKMKSLDGPLQHTTDFGTQKYPKPAVSSNMLSSGSDQINAPTTNDNCSREPDNSNFPLLSKSGDYKVNRNELRALKRPTGWLRSSPVARNCNAVPHPKGNRTHLLRRANLDSHLAHLLQVEVDYQVKQRIKQIDNDLKEQLRIIQKGKARKIQKGKARKIYNVEMQSVGCQTAEGVNSVSSESPDFVTERSVLALSDYRYHGERSNGGEGSSGIVQSHKTKETSDKGTSVFISTGRSKPKEIHHNIAFDLTDSQNSVVNENDTYEDDFDASHSHTDDSTSDIMKSKTGESAGLATTNADTCSSLHSVFLSLLASEPKQNRCQPRTTSKVHDTKLKNRSCRKKKLPRSDVVQEPSHGMGVTYTVYDDHPEGLMVSPKLESDKSCDRSKSQSGQDSIKLSIDSNHSSLQRREKTKDVPVLQTPKMFEVTAEVWKEILRGKQADFLARTGSKHATSQECCVTAEEMSSVNDTYHSCMEGSSSSSSSNVKGKEVLEAEGVSEVYQEFPKSGSLSYIHSDYNGHGTSNSICSSYTSQYEINSNIFTSSRINSEGAESSYNLLPQNIDVVKPIKISASSIFQEFGAQVHSEMINISSIGSHKASQDWTKYDVGRTGHDGNGTGFDGGTLGSNVVVDRPDMNDSSIGDISARIAALLVPRRVSVSKINTDSISSYIPSDLGDTTSNLSDMTQD